MSAWLPEDWTRHDCIGSSRSCSDGEIRRERNAAANDRLKQMKRSAA